MVILFSPHRIVICLELLFEVRVWIIGIPIGVVFPWQNGVDISGNVDGILWGDYWVFKRCSLGHVAVNKSCE